MVRSKNEVIVAGILEDIAPGRWTYEEALAAPDGSMRLPDFTIDQADGSRVYWEHLGMLQDPRYKADWEAKLRWYRSLDILPAEEGGGKGGTLLVTDDLGGVNEPAWRALAETVIGTSTTFVPATPKRRRR